MVAIKELTSTETKMLEKLYERLRNKAKKKSSLEKNSVFISFEKRSSTTRENILSKSALESNYIDTNVAENLVEGELVREVDEEYVLTAKGVWLVERNRDILNDEKIIKHFDERMFDELEGNDLSKKNMDRQKVAFLAMIAGRCFSENVPMNLDDEEKSDIWKEITDDSFQLLKDLNLITSSLQKEDLYFSGNKTEVEGITRRAKLAAASDNIFQNKGRRGKKYYLDIAEDGDIDKEKLQKLFDVIFGEENVTYADKKKIKDFCSEVSNSKSIELYPSNTRNFSSPVYTKKIRSALMDY